MPLARQASAPIRRAPAPSDLASSPPRTDRFERSQWERIDLAPDIELHVRRPLPRPTAKQVDRLIVDRPRPARGGSVRQPRPASPPAPIGASSVPPRRSHRFVLVEVDRAVGAASDRERAPVNLAFVIDRSGSMGGEKIELAKQAVARPSRTSSERDRFSVVAYDDAIDVVVESTPASDEARRNAIARLARDRRPRQHEPVRRLAARLRAGRAAPDRPRRSNRVLLLTDGLANTGITDPDELAHHAAELRARGVSTTTFGVGNDFDEALLQAMADAGGGHFYYIASAAQIRDHIASEVGETLEVVARDVALELVAGEGVTVETISPASA